MSKSSALPPPPRDNVMLKVQELLASPLMAVYDSQDLLKKYIPDLYTGIERISTAKMFASGYVFGQICDLIGSNLRQTLFEQPCGKKSYNRMGATNFLGEPATGYLYVCV